MSDLQYPHDRDNPRWSREGLVLWEDDMHISILRFNHVLGLLKHLDAGKPHHTYPIQVSRCVAAFILAERAFIELSEMEGF